MAHRLEITVAVTTVWEHGEPIDTDGILQTLREHLTDPEGTLSADYGPGAWGGYEGPYLTEARLVVVRQRRLDERCRCYPANARCPSDARCRHAVDPGPEPFQGEAPTEHDWRL